MGIYDREYYRRDKGSFLGSWGDNRQCWLLLILVNVGVYVLQILTMQREGGGLKLGPFTDALILDSAKVLNGQVWRLVTYAFLHDPENLSHILFNMFFFWMFAQDIEDIYGSREFLALYFGTALFGGICFVVFNKLGVPGDRCLGASGVVMAVVTLSVMHFPTRIILLFFVIPVPIWLFLVFALAHDAYFFVMFLRHGDAVVGTGTAVTVHLAGAAFAYLYYKRQWRLLNLFSGMPAFKLPRSRPKLRVYRGEEGEQPVAVASSVAPDVDEHLEAQLDAVLEKVARTGKDSLTDNEREILLRASEAYRKRRT